MLVAVSGGADSVALLAALHELRDELAIRGRGGHLDHGLRGAESDADRAFVEALAARLAIPLVVERAQLAAGNVEAEARHARYAFLARAAAASGATKIATAHTQDDQAETLLLRLLRGAGRRGLGGIRPRRGAIIRPLLLCDRVQVRYFLCERGLAWRRDRSNFDFGLARTRVRAGYLPALARELNPRLSRALARLADVLRDEDVLLDRIASTVPGMRERLDLAVLAALEPAIARRVVRRWWRRLGSGTRARPRSRRRRARPRAAGRGRRTCPRAGRVGRSHRRGARARARRGGRVRPPPRTSMRSCPGCDARPARRLAALAARAGVTSRVGPVTTCASSTPTRCRRR